jgi:hypothetical protein
MMEEVMPTAKATAAPRKRTAPTARKATTPAKAAPATAAVEPEEIVEEEIEVDKHIIELTNMGRTKKGEGKDDYFNLHGRINGAGIRGQIFAPPGAIRCVVLIEYPLEVEADE